MRAARLSSPAVGRSRRPLLGGARRVMTAREWSVSIRIEGWVRAFRETPGRYAALATVEPSGRAPPGRRLVRAARTTRRSSTRGSAAAGRPTCCATRARALIVFDAGGLRAAAGSGRASPRRRCCPGRHQRPGARLRGAGEGRAEHPLLRHPGAHQLPAAPRRHPRAPPRTRAMAGRCQGRMPHGSPSIPSVSCGT